MSEKVHRIEIPTPFPVGNVNVYLIEGSPLTLIDTGPKTAHSSEALKRALAKFDYSTGDIERIILTHGHLDHFGQAGEVKRASGAEICVHEWDEQVICDLGTAMKKWKETNENFVMKTGLPRKIYEKIMQYQDLVMWVGEPVEIDRTLRDGDTISSDFELKVIHTPGHSPGHICLYAPSQKILFSGDHILRDITPNPFVASSGRGLGLRNYLDSVRKIEKLDAEITLTGHGAPVEDLGAVIRSLYSHHEARKKNIMEVLDGGGEKTPYDISCAIFKNLPLSEVLLGLAEVMSHLEVLVEDGKVDSREKGRLVYYNKIS